LKHTSSFIYWMTKPVFYIIGLLILSFGLAVILASIHSQQSSVHAQSVASVSIVKGSSSPSIAKPYDPSPVTIKPGTSVTWTNNDSTLHTVSSGLPEQGAVGTLFDSSLIAPGKTFTHAFDKAGSFDYSCTLHPFMRGQVVVK
ncbi:MAG: plastocyanin/azurin family copper-binding protein, partial [Nitrososphaeraceae archaeon]